MPVTSKRVLLISNSTLHGRGYLDHAEGAITDILDGAGRVLFVPFALRDHAEYTALARPRFEAMGFGLDSIHETSSARRAVDNAAAIFIGGGNTFRLLKALYEWDLLDGIRRKVEAGMPYIGSSAGSNVAGPTIRTTNDMPILEPPSLTSLGLVEFQLNPHYLDPDPQSTHMGETREERIRQYHEENERPVVGLREGTWLRVEGSSIVLQGHLAARIFRRGQDPVEVPPGAELRELLG